MKIIFLSICSLFFVGCVTFPATSTNYSFISIDKTEIPNIKVSGVTEGESCFIALSNLRGDGNFAINKALENAIESGKKRGFEGNFLVDAQVIQTDSSSITINKTCFRVRGKLAAIQKK